MSEIVNGQKVTGLRELSDALLRLGADASFKIARGAVGAATVPIYEQAKQNAAVLSGTLRRSIYRAWIKEKSNKDRQTWFISVRRGKRYRGKSKTDSRGRTRKTANRDAFYWTWVEFGHLAVGPKGKIRGGARRRDAERTSRRAAGARYVPGQKPITRAYESKKSAAVAAMRDELEKRIFAALPRVPR